MTISVDLRRKGVEYCAVENDRVGDSGEITKSHDGARHVQATRVANGMAGVEAFELSQIGCASDGE